MLSWYVIYPRGNRSRLDIAQVLDYEKSDWDIAYDYGFDDTPEGEAECRAKMQELGDRHSKGYPGPAYLT